MFTPLCIYNNTEGDRDAAALAAYGERAWNNPVVRVVDERRRDVVEGLSSDWSARALAATMVGALRARKRPVPAWLSLFADNCEVPANCVETAVFGMS